MRIVILLTLFMLLPGVGAGQNWIEHAVDENFDRASYVHASDMDGDGDTDVLGVGDYTNTISWWENVNGTGTDWTEHLVSGSFTVARSAHAADLDNDGDMDVIGAAENDGVVWWENIDGTGTNWTEHIVDSNLDRAISAIVADIDGDGDADVLAAVSDDNMIAWWENTDGSGTNWIENEIDNTFTGAHSVFTADVDGDGDCDVIGAAWSDGEITWWENANGLGTVWNEQVIDGELSLARTVYASDMDGDNDIDVLGAIRGDDVIVWWENADGAGTLWSEHTIAGDFDGANSVFAADVDGDGDNDVLGTAVYADDITWWENIDGSGTIWNTNCLDSEFDYARSAYASDVDNDGDIDIIGAALDANEISWWENQSYLTIELEPYGTPIVIPSQGGSFDFLVRIVNTSSQVRWFSAWTEAVLPNGNLVSPVQLNSYVGIGPNSGFAALVSQAVPSFAPAGEYEFIARLGTFPNLAVSADSFGFTKSAVDIVHSAGSSNWSAIGWDELGCAWDISPHATNTPSCDFTSVSVYPNPFNASTAVTVQLGDAAVVNVTVYDLLGREVAVLARGEHPAGAHRFVFDSSHLASGLYFVRASVPGEFDQTRKVMLVR